MNKKLIEVALPLDAINAASMLEKSIRCGHPSTLHLWWSRKPLAAARAVLWASLVDDPSSHPELFPTEEEENRERRRLHDLLAKLFLWSNTNNEEILHQARAEIKKYMGNEKLVFLDPFAGGGSIPLEAQRLGLKAHAQDINPVAVLINKAMIEIPPMLANLPPVNPEATTNKNWRGVAGLAEDIRYYGQWMLKEAYRRIGHLYPKIKIPQEQGGGEATVIAWIWARTVKCPNPACGCEMPLANSFVLSRRKGHEAWIDLVINGRDIQYVALKGICPPDKESFKTGKGASFICPACKSVVSRQYIHEEFVNKKNGIALIAIIAEGKRCRIYLSPDKEQADIATAAVPAWQPAVEMDGRTSDLISGRGYGFTHWKQIFTNRQLVALTTFSDLVSEARKIIEQDVIKSFANKNNLQHTITPRAYADAVATYLAFAVDKTANRNNSLCAWQPGVQCPGHLFARQAIPIIWNYAEANIFGPSGSFQSMFDNVIDGLQSTHYHNSNFGVSELASAKSDYTLNNVIISTDPPYYDNIGYADVSDFFYIWLRNSLKDVYPNLFKTLLTYKSDELAALAYRFDGDKQKAREFFEKGMSQACQRMYDHIREDVPLTIYYAYKQGKTDEQNLIASTGWEIMLLSIINAGFIITGTWPIRTERSSRSNARQTNALASSIVLVCRKRPLDAKSISKRDFISELKRELRYALKNLQGSNIAPVDLTQAAIGPGMAVFSRYKSVLEADGKPVSVRSALQIINQEVVFYLSAMDGELDPESCLCLAIYEQGAFNAMPFGDADILSRAKNASIQKLVDAGVLYAGKGVVRLLERAELPKSYNTKILWLLAQQLTFALETGGLKACSGIIHSVAGIDMEKIKSLVYRLYLIAERKGWSKEARAYNVLVTAWMEIRNMVSS